MIVFWLLLPTTVGTALTAENSSVISTAPDVPGTNGAEGKNLPGKPNTSILDAQL